MIYVASYILVGLLVLMAYRLVESKDTAYGDITRKADFDVVEETAKILLGSVPISMRCGFAFSRALDLVFNILRWPVLALDLARRLMHTMHKDSAKTDESLDEFTNQGTLWRYMSIPDIEAREKIIDPAGGAPEVAFGHLNLAWLNFKSQFRPGDKIGRYECLPHEEKTSDSWSHGGEGYILVRKGRVVAKVLARSG
jgi:hypothetical protein